MTALRDIPLKTIDGRETSLAAHEGQVLLIVNVASKCGLTPQYEGLEALHERYGAQGLTVMGFPANDFGNQEPGTEAEIDTFCRTNFGVAFPMFAEVTVSGPDKHPLYAALTEAAPEIDTSAMRSRLEGHGLTTNPPPEVVWNFEKFLVGRDGEVIGRFAPDTKPDDPALVTAIERELFASE